MDPSQSRRNEPPQICMVSEADFDELASLRIAAMRESLERVGRFDPERARERLRATFDPMHTHGIVVGGQRVGFFATRMTEDELWLDHLYIHPSFQGRGLGSAVLAIVADMAEELGRPLLVGALKESRSNDFYQKHGFQFSHEGEWDNYYRRDPSARSV